MSLRQRSRRAFVAGLVLVALGARALIPPGFMPAGDGPFSFEICWEGSPAAMLAHSGPAHTGSASTDAMDMAAMSPDAMAAHTRAMSHGGPLSGTHTHHHPGNTAHSEHCVFGTACSTGPAPHLALPGELPPGYAPHVGGLDSTALTVQQVHLPQPRAPPGSPS